MLYFWIVLLISLNALFLATVPFALPGNWLIVIATSLFAWWRADDAVFSLYTLIAITVLAFIGEVLEFLGGPGGARKAGAGLAGTIGAVIGAIVGALLGTFIIPIPGLGTILGSCIGAGLGAWGLERLAGRDFKQSYHLGLKAGMGQFIGTTMKFAVGIAIWFIIVVAAFWP